MQLQKGGRSCYIKTRFGFILSSPPPPPLSKYLWYYNYECQCFRLASHFSKPLWDYNYER